MQRVPHGSRVPPPPDYVFRLDNDAYLRVDVFYKEMMPGLPKERVIMGNYLASNKAGPLWWNYFGPTMPAYATGKNQVTYVIAQKSSLSLAIVTGLQTQKRRIQDQLGIWLVFSVKMRLLASPGSRPQLNPVRYLSTLVLTDHCNCTFGPNMRFPHRDGVRDVCGSGPIRERGARGALAAAPSGGRHGPDVVGWPRAQPHADEPLP
jgi:hypothetical protein